jgi:hypothetical protein
MNLDDWIDAVVSDLHLDDAVDRSGVTDITLDLAREVAHGVERRAAPITTFLLGVAVGRSDDPKTAVTTYAAAIAQALHVHDQAVAEGGHHPVEEVGGQAGGGPA